LIQDSRESNPLVFNHPYIEEVLVQKLDVGDYAIQYKTGFIPPIVFERKEHGDLVQSLTSNYNRFKREILRAKEQGITLIIAIEKPLTTILNGRKYGIVKGLSIFRKLLTLRWKYGVEHIYFKNREEMATYIVEYYIHLYHKYHKTWNQ